MELDQNSPSPLADDAFGFLKGTVHICGDIIEPVDATGEAGIIN